MAENLKAFDQLKETTAWSLSQKEKADLNAINQNDIREAKTRIENKTFVVDGRTMTLKYIVENLKINKSWDRATLFWKEIPRESELWAAIQVYVIAYNKDVGRFLIDWKVWWNTIKWIQGTQTEQHVDQMRQEQRETVRADIGELIYWKVWPFLTKYKNAKYNLVRQDSAWLATSWKLRNMSDSMVKWNIVTIKYTSNVWKLGQQTVNIDVSKCRTWNWYSANKFWQAIETAITARESHLQKQENERKRKEDINSKNNSAEKWIESFKESNITDPLVKKRATLNNINFKCITYDNSRIMVYDENHKIWWDRKNWWFMLNNADVLTNWKFDSVKFNKILKTKCHSVALERTKKYINETNNSLNSTRVTSASTADSSITKYNDLITEINSLWARDELRNVRQKVEQGKKLAETKKFCYEELSKMDVDISRLNNMNWVLTSANKNKVIAAIVKYSTLKKLSTWRFNYTYKMYTKNYDKYTKAGLSENYQAKLRTFRKIASIYEIDIQV